MHPLSGALSGLWARPTARGALILLAVLMLAALLAPVIAPYSPTAQPDIVSLKRLPPSMTHPFGTDQFSRDVLSRVLYGGRVSLGVALLAVALSSTIGTAYGAVSGFYGGAIDGIMMRVLDAFLAIPRILLLIAVVALWGSVTLPMLVILLGATGWFAVSRMVRAEVLALREREFVAGARALGASDGRLLARHVLPNVLAPVIVAATLGVGHVIMLEAGLSFLGLGVQAPLPSWGNIIQEGSQEIRTLWWMSVFPGLAIVATTMAFNVLGDALRDALDPRQLPPTRT
jgi:peptide/nickel transport system permease protein